VEAGLVWSSLGPAGLARISLGSAGLLGADFSPTAATLIGSDEDGGGHVVEERSGIQQLLGD
jgi:hypothetical protein